MKPKLALGTLLFAATIFCNVISAQDYTHAIPSDALGVVRIDAARIIELSGENFPALFNEYMEENKPQTGPLFPVAAVLADIVNDPENSGLDLSSPLYIFFSPQNQDAGIAAQVADRRKLEALSLDAAKRTDGKIGKVKKVTYMSDPKGRFMFDDRAAVMIRNGSGEKFDAKKECRKFAARGGGSIVATEGFRRLSQTAGEAAFMISGAAIDDEHISAAQSIYKDVPINDLALVFGLSSGEGAAEAEWRIAASGDRAERYIERNAAMQGPADGRYADRIPDSAAFVSYGAVHGELMVAMLQSALDELSADENPYRDPLIRVLSSLDGDFALFLTEPVIKEMGIDFGGALMAAVKNRAVMDFLDDMIMKNDIPLTKTANGYVLTGATGGTAPSIIERDGTIILTSDGINGIQPADNPLKAKIAGCYGYGYVDVKRFTSPEMISMLLLLDNSGNVAALLKRIDSIESIAPTPFVAHCTIRFTSPDDSIYKIMAETAAAIAACSGSANSADENVEVTEAAADGEE